MIVLFIEIFGFLASEVILDILEDDTMILEVDFLCIEGFLVFGFIRDFLLTGKFDEIFRGICDYWDFWPF